MVQTVLTDPQAPLVVVQNSFEKKKNYYYWMDAESHAESGV
jgi:hypothetical protein